MHVKDVGLKLPASQLRTGKSGVYPTAQSAVHIWSELLVIVLPSVHGGLAAFTSVLASDERQVATQESNHPIIEHYSKTPPIRQRK